MNCFCSNLESPVTMHQEVLRWSWAEQAEQAGILCRQPVDYWHSQAGWSSAPMHWPHPAPLQSVLSATVMSAEASLETHVDDYHRQLEFYAIEKISQWLSY